MELKIPRARLQQPDGSTTEFRSSVLPHYQRRTQKVDAPLLGAYLAGANTRRIRKPLRRAWAILEGRQRALRPWANRELPRSPSVPLYK